MAGASLEIDVHAPTINKGFPGMIQTEAMIVTNRWAKNILQVARKYPRKRRGQVYQRTLTLKNGWRIEGPTVTQDGIVVAVKNDVKYVEKVHGNRQGRGQVEIHQNRWKTQPEILASGDNLQRQLQTSINRRISQFFLR